MTTLELARLQFALTTLFHFIFVPISIGLAVWVAICQTLHYLKGQDVYWDLTRYWGRIMLISIAVGVVTGLVQEFQFGMNWAEYSRFVGNVFGAPLAIEGLAAFFLESTFLGLWLFGRDRLGIGIHLATIWLTAVGSVLSAYFILAANAWMQHPVGYHLASSAHKVNLVDVFAVLGNPTLWTEFPHTLSGALLTGAMVVIGISAWNILRRNDLELFSRSLRYALPIALVMSLLTIGFGDQQARLLEREQPMKMAVAEGLYQTERGAGLSLFAVAPFEAHPKHLTLNIQIPHLEALIATLSWNGKVEGIDQAQREEERRYGPGNYEPIIGVVYWAWRIMVGIGFLLLALTLVGCLLLRRGRIVKARRLLKGLVLASGLPILANWAGWIFAEVGRQPWVVFGLLRTSEGVSRTVSSTELIASLSAYLAVYAALTVFGLRVVVRQVTRGPELTQPAEVGEDDLALAY